MNKKIVFFDIDGTLVDEDKKIPSSTKLAIKELRANDVYIAIATGRPPFMFEELREELEIDSYISFNGQHVVFEGETIYENPIELEMLQKLHADTLPYDYPMLFLNENEIVVTAEHPHIKKSFQNLNIGSPRVDPDFYLENTVLQALLYCQLDEEKIFESKHKNFNFLRWHKYSCDILPLGGSKAVGINKILEAGGLTKAESFAFGDGLNDLEMIQEVGVGIAMGNAVPQLKSAADFITDDVDAKGVINALEKYKLL